jgi:aspartate aminotransferase
MTKAFRTRRDFMYNSLKAIPGVLLNNPDGAFYVFPDISSFFGKSDGETTIQNDEDFSMYLLHKAHVSTVMGSAFGNTNCVRMSFATSMDKLEEAVKRIREALARLK